MDDGRLDLYDAGAWGSRSARSTAALGDGESVRLAPAQDMHFAAGRGLFCHGDELLERGDLRYLMTVDTSRTTRNDVIDQFDETCSRSSLGTSS